jgi:preprotein translocase subunit SecG
MESFLIFFHILFALLLILSVLLQKSDGGALGIGNSSDNLMSSRTAGNFLTKFTAFMALLFIFTSISLTLIHKKELSQRSILDKIEQTDKNKSSLPKIPASK